MSVSLRLLLVAIALALLVSAAQGDATEPRAERGEPAPLAGAPDVQLSLRQAPIGANRA